MNVQDALKDLAGRMYKMGFESGRRAEQEEQKIRLQEVEFCQHRQFHRIFRFVCWIRGHRLDPIFGTCRICKILAEDLLKRGTEE